MTLARICALVIVALFARATLARSPGRSFPVYLKDGRTLQSALRPISAYGRVGVYGSDRKLTWLDAGAVDLLRSRPAWTEADALSRLDSDNDATLASLPALRSGRLAVRNPERWTFVEYWTPY
jgi:hypothetical protein